MTRRAQQAITIRSNRVAELLRLHARDGRSQVSIIEDALERLGAPSKPTPEELLQRIRSAVAKAGPPRFASMAEYDAWEYDENGNCREGPR